MSSVIRGILAALALAAAAASAGFAGTAKPAINVTGDRVANKGYDVVAYANAGAAAAGDRRFEHTWHGAIWRFASAANRDRFARDPEKYAPQFGGYCSWAVSRGYTADADPQAWTIVRGKLYLNYSTSVQQRWEQDIPGNIAKAEANWPAVLAR